jgi:DNA topoisomerase-1
MALSLKKKLEVLTNTDPVANAETAGLNYVNDQDLCITRRRIGKGFVYLDQNKHIIKDKKLLLHIKELVIPPAWEEVRICPDRRGHIQATGKDAKGRKQYIYHTEWDAIRNQTKFYRMIKFGEMLPLIRERVDTDLRKRNLTKEKVLALIVRLLEETLIRIGNTEYAKKNKSYGLTTLRDKHFKIENGTPKFTFIGKSGKEWNIDINDKRLAKLIKQCQDIPGQQLFQYIGEDGGHYPVSSTDVNAYLKEITGEDFTAKDFRTWGASVLALSELCRLGPSSLSYKITKRNIVSVVKEAAKALANTTSVCRKYYIHPHVIDSYMDGTIFNILENSKVPDMSSPYALDIEEIALLTLLKDKLKREEI